MEQLAGQLYTALTDLLHDTKIVGLLSAVGDAQARVPYDKAAPKTRMIFTALAENLTRVQSGQ